MSHSNVKYEDVTLNSAALTFRGDTTLVRAFRTDDAPLAGPLSFVDDAWRLDSQQHPTVRLFELSDLAVEGGVLFCEAELRTEGLEGRAYLEMWCRVPGRGEFFSRGFRDARSGSTGWTTAQTPFRIPEGESPDRVRNVNRLHAPGSPSIAGPAVPGHGAFHGLFIRMGPLEGWRSWVGRSLVWDASPTRVTGVRGSAVFFCRRMFGNCLALPRALLRISIIVE
jgi:hypothetical protein